MSRTLDILSVGKVYTSTASNKHRGPTSLPVAGVCYLIESQPTPTTYCVTMANPASSKRKVFRHRVILADSLDSYHLVPATDDQIPEAMRPFVEEYRQAHGRGTAAPRTAPTLPLPVEVAPAQVVVSGLVPLAVPSETVALLKKLVARKNEQIAALGLDVQVDAASVLHGVVKNALAAENAALAAQ
jgi:hypothetical protein